MTIQLKRNDTKDTISYVMTYSDGTPVNLSGASVRFLMGSGNKLITNAIATIVNASTGEVKYTLSEADTLLAGTFKAEFEVTFSDGKVKHFPNKGYIMVNLQQNLDKDQSTYIEDQIAVRISDLQVIKNEIQAQIDQFVKDGVTDQETAQARVEKDGTVNVTLKARLDKKETEFSQGINTLTSQMAQSASLITASRNEDMRVLLISDLHYNHWDGLQGLTSKQRWDFAVKCINEEHEKKPIDMVLIVGDLLNNDKTMPTTDNFPFLKTNVMDKIIPPYYCIHGSHEFYTESQWKALFGYSKNYTIEFGDYAFICIDNYGDSVNTVPNSGFGHTPINPTWLQERLELFKNKAGVFIVNHWFEPSKEAPAINVMKNYPNILGGFDGHIHSERANTKGGIKFYQTGHFSMSEGGSWIKENPWSYRILEFTGGKMNTFIVRPEYQYTEGLQPYFSATPDTVQSFYTENGDFVIKSKTRRDLDVLTENYKEVESIKQRISSEAIVYEGISITPNVDFKVSTMGIGIQGKTTLSGQPSFTTPATMKSVADEGNIVLQTIIDGTVIKSVQISTDPLRSIDTFEIKDEIALETGKKIKRIGVKVLNGSESWNLTSDTAPDYMRVFTTVSGMLPTLSYNDNARVLSDKLPALGQSQYTNTNVEGVGKGANRTIHLKVAKSRLSEATVNGLKAFLTNNPVTVLYELETPVEEQMTDLTIEIEPGSTLTTGNETKPYLYAKVPNGLGAMISYLSDRVANLEKQLNV